MESMKEFEQINSETRIIHHHSDEIREIQLSPSKYVLAKYRIQVIDPHLDLEQSAFDLSEFKAETKMIQHHHHPGPRAIEYRETKEETCCASAHVIHIFWYTMCYPLSLLQACFFRCVDYFGDSMSALLTRMEENYTFRSCNYCCKLETN